MKVEKPISLLFWIAAWYDGVLGLAFFFAPTYVFERFDVTPPNHVGYVQFPAALLLMFAIMFARIALDPAANRSLIFYGVWLKASYSGLAFWYWLSTDIPVIWKPFAIIDLVMGVLFVWAYVALSKPKKRPARGKAGR
jgi:hypothetical protein